MGAITGSLQLLKIIKSYLPVTMMSTTGIISF